MGTFARTVFGTPDVNRGFVLECPTPCRANVCLLPSGWSEVALSLPPTFSCFFFLPRGDFPALEYRLFAMVAKMNSNRAKRLLQYSFFRTELRTGQTVELRFETLSYVALDQTWDSRGENFLESFICVCVCLCGCLSFFNIRLSISPFQ